MMSRIKELEEENRRLKKMYLEEKCNDPLKICTGHTIGEINHEYDDGRRYQEMDCQAQGGFGDGDYSRKDFDLVGFPRL